MGMTPERGPGRKSCEQTEQGERGHAGSSWEVGKDEGTGGGGRNCCAEVVSSGAQDRGGRAAVCWA